MARNRKREQQKLESLRPSEVKSTAQKPLLDIPEEEQWRIIQQSGILHKISDEDTKTPAPEPVPLAEEILDAAFYITPLSFLLLLLEMLVPSTLLSIHISYGLSL